MTEVRLGEPYYLVGDRKVPVRGNARHKPVLEKQLSFGTAQQFAQGKENCPGNLFNAGDHANRHSGTKIVINQSSRVEINH